MYCENCGNKLNENEKFCSNCGKSVKIIEKNDSITNDKDSKEKLNKNDNMSLYKISPMIISIVSMSVAFIMVFYSLISSSGDDYMLAILVSPIVAPFMIIPQLGLIIFNIIRIFKNIKTIIPDIILFLGGIGINIVILRDFTNYKINFLIILNIIVLIVYIIDIILNRKKR